MNYVIIRAPKAIEVDEFLAADAKRSSLARHRDLQAPKI